jgi:uncharacterized lipoprotein YajG
MQTALNPAAYDAAARSINRRSKMFRAITLLVAAALLNGCGLAETGAAAATAGGGAAAQAKEAEKITDKVETDIEAAQQAAAEARRAAEAASE